MVHGRWSTEARPLCYQPCVRPVQCINLARGEKGDRLRDQLMFYPPKDSIAEHQEDADTPLKKILFWNGASSWGIRPGRGIFIKEQCPVSSCVIATNRRESQAADLIVFKDHFTMPGMDRRREQIWMIFMLESPLHTQVFKHKEVFNWTATYRSDSTVVAILQRQRKGPQPDRQLCSQQIEEGFLVCV